MFQVSIRYQQSYILEEVRKHLEVILSEAWRQFPNLKRGDRVLLKPNLLSGKPPESAVTTHPVVLEAMIQILLDHGCRITIGDSPALHPFARVIKKAGLSPLQKRYPIQFQDLDAPVTIDGIKGGIYQSFEISRHCFEHDYLVNLAKFKTHSMMGLTLSVKNLFGCIPGRRKATWHLAIGKNRDLFARMLVELAAVISADFHLIDGIMGMEGNGPGNGTPTPLGVLLGGENPATTDHVAARIIGLPPHQLLTCRTAAEIGFGPKDDSEIELTGDPLPNPPLPFILPEPMQTDWHLPGFLKGVLRWALLPLPRVDSTKCRGCLDCQKVCPPGAIYLKGNKISIKESLCIRCYCCQEVCPENAISFRKRGVF